MGRGRREKKVGGGEGGGEQRYSGMGNRTKYNSKDKNSITK